MQSSPFSFEADDGASLFVHRWAPDPGVAARGLVHISHGMAEHGARYARLAEALTAAGYLVYANDHRGHGRTAKTDADLGYFAMAKGWDRVVRDLGQLVAQEQRDHPGLPTVLLGHSMGSLLSQQYLYEYGSGLAGAVLSGTKRERNLLITAGRVLARIERLRLGARGRSVLLDRLSFGKYNDPFRPSRTAFDWLSRDPTEVDRYVADPRCGFVVTTSMFVDLLDGVAEIAKPEHQARIPKDLPIYLIAGELDPVGNRTKEPRQLARAYRRAGLRRVECKFYPGARHEIFNETNRDEVTEDLIRWLEANVH
jgi:alpha-beta hydrolase superfamily lysophospholipase